ncbi:hypothetical protein D6D15_04401 [Aureobasidium pullulans]|uniref:Uncharacterized protein n=1 Tax=Aureobasidium pullulans TaxID=5580 RepID=A0A4S9BBW8_AURPU|nr:hypothetical protein D6D15_04401 [Aureobasidium pullulans]
MASRNGSSSNSTTQPPVRRQHSDTHVFPAKNFPDHDAMKPQGLSESTKALARQVLHPELASGNDYSPGVFSGGTKWLLDSVNETEKAMKTPRKPSLLTETAVKKHNDHDPRKKHLVLETASNDGSGREEEQENKPKPEDIGRTDAWVSQQTGDSDVAS